MRGRSSTSLCGVGGEYGGEEAPLGRASASPEMAVVVLRKGLDDEVDVIED